MSRHIPRVAATIAALAFATTATIASAQTINLTGNDATTAPIGKGQPATFGQTFTAPVGFGNLQNFSFWLSNDVQGLGLANPSALRFQAYVMQWDAVTGHATGPVLYSSSIQSGPTALSQRYDFLSINKLLGAGQYVAFLSASGLFGSIGVAEATVGIESTFSGLYGGGQAVYADNGDDFGALSTTQWLVSGDFPEYQSHFVANFTSGAVSVVPEPSSLLLLVSGLTAMVVVAVRKKRV